MTDSGKILHAGPLQLLYENGLIRRISYEDHEFIRMIYFAFRDEEWVTLPHEITEEKVDVHPDGFTVSFSCTDRKNGQDIFKWEASVKGDSGGQITFELHGKALTAQKKNRVGFCILHPLREVIGQPAEIRHSDGTISQKKFPVLVSPENPFKNIQSMRWTSYATTFELLMEGDVFETEDQRNWADGSFKTFCTPSDLPIPVLIEAGHTIHQKVTLRPVSPLARSSSNSHSVIQLEALSNRGKLPAIGIGASTEVKELNEETLDRLKSLRFDHYRIEVTPGKQNWVSDYSHDYQQSFSLGIPLFIALHLSENFADELEAFITLSLQNRVRIKSILLLNVNRPVTAQAVIDHVSNQYKKLLPKVLWGAGTNYNFNDLNKTRIDLRALDFVCYSLHPQEHVFDDLSLIENLEGQTETAKSARHLYPGKAVYGSPVTLKKRFNPAAKDPGRIALTEAQKQDPRQLTSFCARWMAGSLRAFAEGQADSVTYFQTAGKQGLVSETGEPYPVYALLIDLLPFRNHNLIFLKNTHPMLIDALLFDNIKERTLWLINHSVEDQTVQFENTKIRLSPHEIKQLRLDRAQ
jgi:hypothetical protein